MTGAKGNLPKLTAREIEVLKLVATGFSRKEIATALGISIRTVEFHRSQLMEKLDIHDVANLTRYAIREGYVDLGGPLRPSQQRQVDLFDRLRKAEAQYRRAMEDYAAFLQERESIGLTNPDGVTGARRLRHAEEIAHSEYHAALVALKEFLQERN